MQDYIRYEIETRKFSANVIIGIYIFTNEKGDEKEKTDIILIPALKKEDGDIYAEKIYQFLNS